MINTPFTRTCEKKQPPEQHKHKWMLVTVPNDAVFRLTIKDDSKRCINYLHFYFSAWSFSFFKKLADSCKPLASHCNKASSETVVSGTVLD
jgi:hypothetical protein